LFFDGWVRTTIKTGNPRPFQGTLSDQIGTTSIEPSSCMSRVRQCNQDNFAEAFQSYL
jgi:hypothetical protein